MIGVHWLCGITMVHLLLVYIVDCILADLCFRTTWRESDQISSRYGGDRNARFDGSHLTAQVAEWTAVKFCFQRINGQDSTTTTRVPLLNLQNVINILNH